MKIRIITLLICCLLFHIGCAEKSSLPEAEDIAEFKANSISELAHFKDFKIERRDLEDIINTYHQISEEHWLHSYHHIAMNDVTGIIILKDGTEINWMVRPGGLATLTYPDGRIIYLAKELALRSEK
jgi:hypothetical protein